MTSTSKTVPIPEAGAFFKGLPWIVLIFVFAAFSWKFWTPF